MQVAPHREDAYEVAVKALIRLEDWPQAEGLMDEMERRKFVKHHYLRGFGARRRGRTREALASLRLAMAAGDRGLRVKRELAYCLFLLERYDEAQTVLSQLDPEATAGSRMLLNLTAHVLTRTGKLEAAEAAIEQLRAHGFMREYYHRLAHLRVLQDRYPEAVDAARTAAKFGGDRMETKAIEARALAAMGRLDEAMLVLDAVQPRSARDRDLRKAQLCHFALQREGWQAADAIWQTLSEPSHSGYRRIRRDIVRAGLEDRTIAEGLRSRLEAELESIERAVDEIEEILPGTD